MRLKLRSAAMRFTALGLAAVMLILLISSIEAIARVSLISRFHPQPKVEFNQTWTWETLPYLPTSAPAHSPNVALRPLLPRALSYTPPQESAPPDPTNFGDRHAKDLYGKPVHNEPLIVLHETVGSADSAINLFQTPHEDENEQVSYHSLIRRDGTIVYIVSPNKRAFGAGDSVFQGSKGPEAVKTNPRFPASVNNFSYHISLESPPDGDNDEADHSGYTDAQYQSLAWLAAQTGISDARITTHQIVDQTGSRFDPRSFDGKKFYALLHNYPRFSVATGSR